MFAADVVVDVVVVVDAWVDITNVVIVVEIAVISIPGPSIIHFSNCSSSS
jgi:hypothetical protein